MVAVTGLPCSAGRGFSHELSPRQKRGSAGSFDRLRHRRIRCRPYRTAGAWRSLVAHLLWEQRVAGSNPAAPTKQTSKDAPVAQGIEHRPSKPGVAGSNPAGRAMTHAVKIPVTLVDVAQLVEPRIVIPAVVGSSPIVHPIFG